MKRTTSSLLIAVIASVMTAPVAIAGPDFNELRRENLDKDAITHTQLKVLDKDKTDFDELLRDNLDKDAIL